MAISQSPAQAFQHGILYLAQDKALKTSAKEMQKVRGIYNYKVRNEVFKDIQAAFVEKAVNEPIADLNRIARNVKQLETRAIGKLEQALIDLSNSTINLTRTKSDKNSGYIKNMAQFQQDYPAEFHQMHDALKSAITALTWIQKSGYPTNGAVASKEQWANVMGRFFKKTGRNPGLQAFADRIVNQPNKVTLQDLSDAVSGFGLDSKHGGQFGQLFGGIIEEALPEVVLKNGDVKKQISKIFGIWVKEASHVDGPNVGATPGTIRTTLNGQINQKAIEEALQQGADKLGGLPLRDNIVKIVPTPQGAKITVETLSDNTTGVSVKWRKLTDKHNDIKLADLSMANFFPTIIQERSSAGMYIIRELAAQGDSTKNGVMNWLLAHNLDAITRGTEADSDVATADLTDFMIINGKMMTVRKAMSMGNVGIKVSGLPSHNRRWIKGIQGNAAANFISAVHDARVKAYINISSAGRAEIMK